MAKRNVRKIGRSFLAFILNFVLIFGVVFNLAACAGKQNGQDGDAENPEDSVPAAFVNEYPATTKVGYYGRITNPNVPRNIPQTMDSEKGPNAVLGEDYPRYGAKYQGDKATAIAESERLVATGTKTAGNGGGYDFMDENGVLFSGTRASYTITGRSLYKHVASVDNYHGNVSDSQPAVEKVITFRDRGYGSYNVTGIYAPAGEVIKIRVSEKDMNATGGITVHIGQCLYDGRNNNIWAAAGYGMTRMPHLMNTMQVNKNTAEYDAATKTYTAYVGSFLGGPVYIRNSSATFTVTISGGVEYPHFILGYTTEAEYNRLITTTSAPYFDLEVWDHGVLMSGPRIHAEKYSYSELYQAAILWEKVSSVSTQLNDWGIVFLFDPFVAAGAAVSFGGSVNCPEGWMSSVLNYNQLVTSGDWGDFHEYHHNFQGFGVGGGGEVTNNSMTLVSYALFTKISASRSINNFGGDGLGGGWNRYTSATWALEETLKITQHAGSPGNGNQGLALYATLLHNFGPENFIKTAKAGKSGGQNYQNYMNVWEKQTHNNMYYYFNNILGGGVSQNNDSKSYPMFVPVSCVYQTGRSYIDGETGEKQYIKTMQPFQIKDDEPFTVDLSEYTAENGTCTGGSIVIPDGPNGFTYTVKNVTQPAHGSVEWNGGTSFTYTPESGKTSGEIKVTLEITKKDNAFEVDDVDLVLEFQPTKELNKLTLERTVYTYAEKKYTEATEAFDHNFEGYESKKTADHSSPGQNVNTDIWFRGEDSEANREKYPNEPDHHFTDDNQVHVIDGKMYFDSDGKYRVYVRARFHAALYFSLNGTDYELGGKIDSSSPAAGNGLSFRGNDPNTYFDIEFNQGKVKVYLKGAKEATSEYTIGSQGGKIENWLYIKEVLIVNRVNTPSQFDYIGVGMKKWDKFQYNIAKTCYDASGKVVADEGAEGYEYTISNYTLSGYAAVEEIHKTDTSKNKFQINRNDGKGLVTVSEAEFKEFVETPVLNNQPYANAYRRNYEFPDNSQFEADYFYKREYNYDYTDNIWQNQEQTVVSTNYDPSKQTTWGGYPFDLEKLTDGNKDTWIHTSGRPTADNPLEFVIDMGSAKAVNRMSLFSQYRPNGDRMVPKSFSLYGSLDGENFFLVYETTAAPDTQNSTYDFEEKTFRYYKFVITESYRGYIIIAEIEMWRMFGVSGGKQLTPDRADLSYVGDWHLDRALSSFGHVYVGGEGATLSFDFEGTRLGILSSSMFGKNFEVYIDGNKIDSLALKEDDGFTVLTYLSDALQSGKHHVEIKCTGEANIDSIVVYP